MSEIDTTSEEFQQAVQAKLDEQAAGLQSALKAEREARKTAERQAAQFKGIDPERYAELVAAAEKAEAAQAKDRGDFDRLLERERTKFNDALGERDAKIASLTGSLERTLIESAAKSAISAMGGDADLLLPHVTARVKLIEVGDEHRAVVVDEKGDPRLAPGAKSASDFMGVQHLVESWKSEGRYPGAFAGTGSSGMGTTGGVRPSVGGKRMISSRELVDNLDAVAKGEVAVAFD